ncbi:MAG: hypothetical protein J6L81_06215 [Clostridia bacterium]|nr:hypothetical protein [Clostridia bacterium]
MDNVYSEDISVYEEQNVPAQNAESPYANPDVLADQAPVKIRTYAHPSLVLLLMLLFFPAGIITMLFFTKWGAYAKILVTVFVLLIALSVYEILVLYNVVDLPSLIEMAVQTWNDLF